MMHARSAAWFSSLKSVAGAAAVQGLTQLLVFASGIVVVRNLPIEQYAYYTLATAALGVATALSDSGMSNAVVAQSGRVWQQPDRLGAVLAAGLAIRRKVSLAAVLLLSPILMWLALRQGSPLSQALLLCAAVIPLFLASASTSLLEIPLRLHQRLKSLQLLQTVAGIARLACIALVSFAVPLAWLVVLSALFPVVLFNRKLRERSADIADLRASEDEAASRKIKEQVARSLPGAIYYVFVSQLTILLITVFGTTEGVAQVGALGRIAMIISFLLMVFNMIALPRYARIPESDSRKLLQTYLVLMSAIVVASGLAVLFAWVAPNAVLFILGGNYSSLTAEVVLAVAAGGLAVIAAAASSLAAVRGTVVPPWVSIPPSIAVQALLISLLPLDAVSSMFWLSIAISGVQLVAAAVVFLRRLLRTIDAF